MIWASFLATVCVAIAILLRTGGAAAPRRGALARRFLLAAGAFVVYAGLLAGADIPPVFRAILLAPVVEEAMRVFVLRDPRGQVRPNYWSASYVALLFAVLELNNLIFLWVRGEAPSDPEIGLTPEIYLTLSFPIHFAMDWVGHFAFGAVMVALWSRPILRYLIPVVVHGAVNSNAYW